MPRGSKKKSEATVVRETHSYTHPEAEVLLRPEVGTQAQFRKKKEPRQCRYDSSLAPQPTWDGGNWAREAGDGLVLKRPNGAEIPVRCLTDVVHELKGMSRPLLHWAGKADRLSFQMPSLPLFVHERLSTSVSSEAGERGQLAIRAIDERGNELFVVKDIGEESS